MAGNIKGITIEFRGDTTQLDKALRTVDKEAKSLDSELRTVNKDLKFNPGNTQLLAQKQQILKEKISNTESALDALNKAQAEMDSNKVDKTSAEYREVERRIVEADSKLKTFNAQLKKAQFEASKMGRAAASMRKFGENATKAGQALMPLSLAAGALDVAIGALAYKSGVAADDLNTLSKVTGIGTSQLQKYSLAADLVDVSVGTIAKSQTRMKKQMLSASQGTGSAAKAWDKLGVSVTDSNGNLRDQDAVFQDTLKALGSMKNETERDALAMQIFGKSATELNPLIEDAGETYQRVSDIFKNNDMELVDQATLDKANEFNDSIDTIRATGQLALNTLGMQLAGYLAPAIEKISVALQKVFAWLSKLSPTTLTIIAAIAGVIAVLAPLLLIMGKFAFAISSIMTLMGTLGLSFTAVLAPIAGVVAAIVGLIAIGVLLYKNWDKIKAYLVARWKWIKSQAVAIWNGIKNGIINPIKNAKTALVATIGTMLATVKSKFAAIKNAIVHPIQTARDLIKAAIEKIKGFFKFTADTPHIKLPHFSITPAGWKMKDLLKGKVPKLSIKWMAEGGIFKRPTIFGSSGVGVGEAGAEAVIPLDALWQHMNAMADSIVNGVGMQMMAAGAGSGAMHFDIYLAPNTPKLQEIIVDAYDSGKRRLG